MSLNYEPASEPQLMDYFDNTWTLTEAMFVGLRP